MLTLFSFGRTTHQIPTGIPTCEFNEIEFGDGLEHLKKNLKYLYRKRREIFISNLVQEGLLVEEGESTGE